MLVLVAYATRHGSTRGIAERVGATLSDAAHRVTVAPVDEVGDVGEYDALVIGSATYLGHWLKEATALVERVQPVLAGRPVWLFSSGPLGTAGADTGEPGHDRAAAVAGPKELADLTEALSPREHRIFSGALDPAELGVLERAVRKHPAARQRLPEGDFRDWAEIVVWARGIADALAREAH